MPCVSGAHQSNGKRMESTRALLSLWVLTVLFFDSAQADEAPENISPKPELSHLQRAVLCSHSNTTFTNWSSEQRAALLSSVSRLAQCLHSQQLRDCDEVEPQKCPAADAPENGGVLCVALNNRRFCKPMCNHGFDFGFLRQSRLFDECSDKTEYRWDSQYVGGNTLALCIRASVTVSGAKSAYFPKEQDCLQTKANSTLSSALKEQFIRELEERGHQGELQRACLVCGLTR
ncbi:uncharacterized protein si:ch1073-126c3.2 isoform X2 [Boleophthalmus pectinirostris]|uniref:uncharacterized protein si:ch1073-126c3.2 isoform X2 n=1 Tax=Boleophthalmus pectinirostris TaxID=150288 RepID=UPI002431FD3F|nr:uncharacterized protein si:ch1073-126c3.2 isoform X2 [Boleophthalmus pectinirostris]